MLYSRLQLQRLTPAPIKPILPAALRLLHSSVRPHQMPVHDTRSDPTALTQRAVMGASATRARTVKESCGAGSPERSVSSGAPSSRSCGRAAWKVGVLYPHYSSLWAPSLDDEGADEGRAHGNIAGARGGAEEEWPRERLCIKGTTMGRKTKNEQGGEKGDKESITDVRRGDDERAGCLRGA